MNCRRAQQLLPDFQDERLTGRAAAKMAAHVRDCPACRRLHDALTTFEGKVRRVAERPPALHRDLSRRAVERWTVERPAGATARRLWLLTPPAPATGAAMISAAAVLLLGLARWEYGRRSGFPASRTAQRDVHALLEPGGRPDPHPQASHGGDRIVRGAPVPPGSRTRGQAYPSRPSRRAMGYETGGGQAHSGDRGAPAPVVDDLDSLNRSPEAGMPPWERVNPWDRIEAGVRRAVPVRDDFVQIPFPRLAAASAGQTAAGAEKYQGGEVRIPHPRLPSAPDRQIVAAVEAYRREAAIVDPRLGKAVTLALKATALADVCERLKADSGIDLRAGPSVADEKVTVFCEKQPLREVMRQLSRPFGYTWLRSRSGFGVRRSALGKAFADPNAEPRTPNAEYRYELAQDLRGQLLEEELRNRDRYAALLALEKEIERYRPFLGLSPEEARARAKTAAPEEKKLLENLAGWGWGPLQLYSRLSAQDQAALRAGQRLSYSSDPERVARDGVRPLPPELDRGVLQSFPGVRITQKEGRNVLEDPRKDAPDGRPPTSVPEAHGIVTLKVGHSELGQFTLDGGSGVTVGTQITIRGHDLATGVSPAVRDPKNEIANAPLARDPALQPRVTMDPVARRQALEASPAKAAREEVTDPTPSSARVPAERVDLALGASKKVTTADVLEALHRASGLPVVADFYTRLYPQEAVVMKDQPLFEALNHLADAMHLRWKKEGGWLQFRSVSYYDDRVKEVPNRLLARWATARRQSARSAPGTGPTTLPSGGTRPASRVIAPPAPPAPGLPLDELIEMAQLSDAQLDSSFVTEGVEEWWGLEEWCLARNRDGRPQLRYLAELTPTQRQTALSAAGLAFSQLSLAQQQRFLAHLGSRLESLEEVAGATLRVEYSQPGWFRWPLGEMPARGQPGLFGLSLVQESTRAAALAAARRLGAQVTEAQIAPTDLSLAVVYTLIDPRTGKTRELGVRARADGARISW